jgi:hypothetical protein
MRATHLLPDTTTLSRWPQGRPELPLEPLGGRAVRKEHRHGRRAGSCGGLSLVGVDGATAAVYPLRCGCWRCPKCGSRKVKYTRERIRGGLGLGRTRFLTLTSPGQESVVDSLELLARRWKAFHRRLTRRVGHIEYLAVVELQKRGSPHLHVLVRGPLVSGVWVRQAAVAVGFGKQSDIRPAPPGIAGYLTKAIGPNTSGDLLPAHFRRVRWSAGWSLPLPRRFRRAWQAWYIAFAETRRTAASAVQRGYRLVELVHGPPDRYPSTRPVRWQSVAAFAGR